MSTHPVKLLAAAAAFVVLSGHPTAWWHTGGHTPSVGTSTAAAHAHKARVRVGDETYRPGGHFVRTMTEDGPLRWDQCGGEVDLDAADFTGADRKVALNAARTFAATVSGPWSVKVVTDPSDAPGHVVVTVGPGHGLLPGGLLGNTTSSWTDADGYAASDHADTVLAGEVHGHPSLERAVLLHELGHAAGADHSPSPLDIMYYAVDAQYHTYTAVEAAGLRSATAEACH